MDKKKKKSKIKNKKNKKEGKIPTNVGHVGSNQPTFGHHAGSVDGVVKSKKKNHKRKFPCMICKGDHILKDFLGIPKVIEVWSQVSSQSMSSTTAGHAGDNPSTSNEVGSKKGKIKFH